MQLSGPNAVLLSLFIIFFIILIFLLIREINCWYWKINQRAESLNRIDKNLQFLIDLIKERQNLEKQDNSEKNLQ